MLLQICKMNRVYSWGSGVVNWEGNRDVVWDPEIACKAPHAPGARGMKKRQHRGISGEDWGHLEGRAVLYTCGGNMGEEFEQLDETGGVVRGSDATCGRRVDGCGQGEGTECGGAGYFARREW